MATHQVAASICAASAQRSVLWSLLSPVARDARKTNEDRVVQQLLDAAADWFRLDEIAKEGLFDVDYPGFE